MSGFHKNELFDKRHVVDFPFAQNAFHFISFFIFCISFVEVVYISFILDQIKAINTKN